MRRDEAGDAWVAAIKAAVLRVARRPVVRVVAAALTATVLLGLVVFKAVTHPAWLASARSGAGECLNGDGGAVPARSGDRLHQMGRLGCVVAKLEPVRTEYLELSIALLLVALLVGEVRLLARDSDIRRRQKMPLRPARGGDGPEQSGRRRPPRPRREPMSPSSPSADRTARPGRSGSR